LPGCRLGNITQVESSGNSSYNALWLTAISAWRAACNSTHRTTWSKSLDYNSLSLQGVVVQDSYDLVAIVDFRLRRAPPLVVSAIYDVPFNGTDSVPVAFGSDYPGTSGNPINIVTSNSTFMVSHTLRPDVTGPVKVMGSVDRWFDTSSSFRSLTSAV